ncbi:exodeoxyribonuclease III [candidate division WOR-3 bacterium]|nr:exodeoxyribonuclease III [candidate division WOR-3 bacterium]
MKIATWNVNSINTRAEYLRIWLEKNAPDVIMLQETKTPDDKFPESFFMEVGYKSYFNGQKSYNGVAILSKKELTGVVKGFDGEAEAEKRLISAFYDDKLIVCVYVPNGKSPADPSFKVKLDFFDKLREKLGENIKNKIIVGGDFNVALRDIDVWDPVRLDGSICFNPEERKKMKSILDTGYVDSYSKIWPEKQAFSWWDYRDGSFHKNHGMRLDYLLFSKNMENDIISCKIDRESRKKAGELKPSDHSPVIAEIMER